MAKGLLLLSGGLDSTLAGRILLKMGVELDAVNFTSPFCRCTPKGFGCSAAKAAADRLGIPVKVLVKGDEYFDIVKQPRHGRGSGMNPCIDCRIFTFTKAREMMLASGADFIATGEVLGQRPMSQRRQAMALIERVSDLQGRIVCPLSAQLLEPTIAELTGLIDRTQLLAIQGRSRKEQIALAEENDIFDYPCPAGGCLLTDSEYSVRLKELIEREPDCRLEDARLLTIGRHFRLPGGSKVVVGRNQDENAQLERSVRRGDWLLKPAVITGPTTVLRPASASSAEQEREDLEFAAGFVARYVQAEGATVSVRLQQVKERAQQHTDQTQAPEGESESTVWRDVSPVANDLLEKCRIGGTAATPVK